MPASPGIGATSFRRRTRRAPRLPARRGKNSAGCSMGPAERKRRTKLPQGPASALRPTPKKRTFGAQIIQTTAGYRLYLYFREKIMSTSKRRQGGAAAPPFEPVAGNGL